MVNSLSTVKNRHINEETRRKHRFVIFSKENLLHIQKALTVYHNSFTQPRGPKRYAVSKKKKTYIQIGHNKTPPLSSNSSPTSSSSSVNLKQYEFWLFWRSINLLEYRRTINVNPTFQYFSTHMTSSLHLVLRWLHENNDVETGTTKTNLLK